MSDLAASRAHGRAIGLPGSDIGAAEELMNFSVRSWPGDGDSIVRKQLDGCDLQARGWIGWIHAADEFSEISHAIIIGVSGGGADAGDFTELLLFPCVRHSVVVHVGETVVAVEDETTGGR